MAIENRLGRGLDALLGAAPSPQATDTVPAAPDMQQVPLESLQPNKAQARKHFDEMKLAELAASIKEQGILQPLLVAPINATQYGIIAGERRWRAAKLAGLERVPVRIIARENSEQQVISLIENLQREDLNPLEEALGIHALMETCGFTQDQVAQKIGKSRSAIANAVRLRALPQAAQDDLLADRISAGHARCLLALDDATAQEELRKRMVEAGMTVRDAENAVAHFKDDGSFPWHSQQSDAPDTMDTDNAAQVRKSGRAKRDATLVAAARRIAANLNCKAKISGDQNKGKITLHYEDTETLEDLLASLGAGGLQNGQVETI